MTNNILSSPHTGGKKIRRFWPPRPGLRRSHRPRLRTPEECIQRWEKDARRRQYIRPKHNNQSDTAVAKGRAAEINLADWLRSQGYQVEVTGNNESFDLVINGLLRIEVKVSYWNEQNDRTRRRPRFRYQWRIHPAQIGQYNLVVCIARNGDDQRLVIPAEVLGSQQSITIRTFDLEIYRGKWSPYLAAWELLEAALAAVRGEEDSNVA